MAVTENRDRLEPEVLNALATSFDLGSVRQLGKPDKGARYFAYKLTTPRGDFAALRPRPHSSSNRVEINPLRDLLRANRIFLHLASQKFPVAAPLQNKTGS